MNDYWNDPPEQWEPPDCCDEPMDLDEATGALSCAKCGKRIEPDPPETFEPFDDGLTAEDLLALDNIRREESARSRCPHGDHWHECNHCMIASDLAFDASREGRR